MMKRFSAVCGALIWLAGISFMRPAGAADVEAGGFVTQSQGGISYQVGKDKAQPLPAFSRLPSGARVNLADDAKLQIVYLRSGRQESWAGKATITIGDDESKGSGSAAPTIKTLPPYMVATLTKSHDVMGSIHTRQGMIRVRSLMTAAKVKEAEAQYAELRAQASEDDITPEIFLLTTLDGLKAYQSMKKPLAEMLRRQPGNTEARTLHDHFVQLLNTGTVEAPVEPPGN